MRIIKALLVLVFLLPTPAAAQPTPESFIRIERDGNREPVALQTAIAKYVPAGSATGSGRRDSCAAGYQEHLIGTCHSF